MEQCPEGLRISVENLAEYDHGWRLVMDEEVDAAIRSVPEHDASNSLAQGGVGPEGLLVRRGKSPESAQRLGKQAAAAESAGAAQNGMPFGHGVSVTTPESNALLARDPTDAVSATRRALEEAGFEVRHTPTRADPNHHTVQLPKPVTDAVADSLNQIFGRK